MQALKFNCVTWCKTKGTQYYMYQGQVDCENRIRLILRIGIDLHHNLENGRATDDENEQRQEKGTDRCLVLVCWQLN